MHEPSIRRGLALMAVSSCCFALMAASAKQAQVAVSFWEATFWRGAITGLVVLWVMRRQAIPATPQKRWLWLRGIVGTSGLLCYFYALHHIPLAQAVMLNNTAPVWTVLLAAIFLQERLRAARLLSLSLAMTGVWLILQPAGAAIATGTWVALVSGLLAGMVQVIIKRLSDTSNPWEVVGYFAFTSLLVALPGTVADFHLPTGWLIAVLLVMGLAGALAQATMTAAYRHLPAGAASTAGLLTVLVSAVLGWVWFAEMPRTATLIGGGLILAGGLGASLPEAWARHRAKREAPQNAATTSAGDRRR